jgi:hypothetical protein
MQQIKHATSPSIFNDLAALQEQIDAAIERTVLMLGGIVLPCAGLVLYVLASPGK